MKPYRKQRIKLVKDLSEGEKSLCHSLLDISEFENIDEVYTKRKIAFDIVNRNVSFIPYIPISEEEAQYDMTATEKIEIYKKLNIKERYNQGSIDRLKKMFKIRRSKIPKMLNNLSQTMKKQTEGLFEKEIRRSEEKLKFYRSQGKLSQDVNQSESNLIKETETRCKFYSLKTGKPQMNEQLFPTFEEYVQGRNRAKLQKKYQFDISKIEKNLNTFYTETEQNPEEESEQMKASCPLSLLAARIGRASSTASNRNGSQAQLSQRMMDQKTEKLKKKQMIQQNLQRFSEQYIQKSERSSQKIVRTMTNFYKSKNTKKQEYNNMVEYYEHDRPLTNSIRRREYEFMKPEEKIREIAFYRKQSQDKRREILEFNSRTYKEILNSLSRYHEDDIPISLEILRSMKQLMRREYVFREEDVRKILREIKKKSDHFLKVKEVTDEEEQKEDFMIQLVINILNKAYGYNMLWIDL